MALADRIIAKAHEAHVRDRTPSQTCPLCRPVDPRPAWLRNLQAKDMTGATR